MQTDPATSLPPLVELRHVDIVRDDAETPACRDVNWSIRPGEFWAVAGELEAGRNSLLETAAGLARGRNGDVRLFGQAVTEATEVDHLAWRSRIGFVFENGGRLLGQLTAWENIALPLVYHGAVSEAAAEELARRLLAEVRLEELADRRPSRLSPPEQQRVAYLRAIAGQKEIVFVDHPLGERWWARELGQRHQHHRELGRPLSVVVTGGDFRSWRTVADRFAVVSEDGWEVIGDRQQLLASSQAHVQELI